MANATGGVFQFYEFSSAQRRCSDYFCTLLERIIAQAQYPNLLVHLGRAADPLEGYAADIFILRADEKHTDIAAFEEPPPHPDRAFRYGGGVGRADRAVLSPAPGIGIKRAAVAVAFAAEIEILGAFLFGADIKIGIDRIVRVPDHARQHLKARNRHRVAVGSDHRIGQAGGGVAADAVAHEETRVKIERLIEHRDQRAAADAARHGDMIVAAVADTGAGLHEAAKAIKLIMSKTGIESGFQDD